MSKHRKTYSVEIRFDSVEVTVKAYNEEQAVNKALDRLKGRNLEKLTRRENIYTHEHRN